MRGFGCPTERLAEAPVFFKITILPHFCTVYLVLCHLFLSRGIGALWKPRLDHQASNFPTRFYALCADKNY